MKILLAIVAVIIILAFGYRMSKPQGQRGGFLDWIKNPDWQEWPAKQAAEEEKQLEQVTVPDNMPEAEIPALVERLLDVETDRITTRKLQLLGERTVPSLLGALNDPRFARGKQTKTWSERLPLEKITDLLEPFGPPEAVPLLAPFVKHKDDEFRKIAALALGTIGSNACIEPLMAALADADDHVRDYAMFGIQRGIKANHCIPRFLEAMFDRTATLLDRSSSTTAGEAPVTLLQIDRARAIAVLLGDRYFTTGNRKLYYILKALNGADITIPAEKLTPVMEALKAQAKDDSFEYRYGYGEALISLARSGDPSAENVIREALDGGNEHVATEAGRALCILKGIPNPTHFVYGRVQEVGFDRLTAAQQTVYTVSVLDAEVRNGGFAQYFVNSSGDHSKESLRGVEMVGAMQTHAIVQQAMQQFGDGGPSSDRSQRARQLAALSAKQDAELDRLNTRFYESKDRLEVKVLLFAVENKDQFSPKP